MNLVVDRYMAELVALSREDRAELIRRLEESIALEDAEESQGASEWERELDKKIADILEGRAVGVPSEGTAGP